MKKICTLLLLAAACSTAHAQYQLGNCGFEEWETVKYNSKTGDEPKLWSSFLDGTGSLKGTAAANQVEKSTDRHSGSYSAKLTCRSILGVVAQGNLTTGCINMGSMKASSADGNYNYVNTSRADQCMPFSGRPDEVKAWIKFKGQGNYGNISIFLVTDGYYQDPDDGNKDKITALKVAHAKKGDIVSNDTWTEVTVPFVYYRNIAPTHVLASFSTCATPGKGNKNDYIYIDDVEMVYWNTLSSLRYNGKELLSGDETRYTVEGYYQPELLTYTTKSAQAQAAVAYSESANEVYVTVKRAGNDNKNYTIKFTQAAGIDGITVDSEATTTYDLQGRAAKGNLNGLRIEGGKKVIR